MGGDTEGSVRGVDAANVTAWFSRNVPDAQPPLAFELIAAGRSNLTVKVSDAAGRAWVLRRPPAGPLLPTAHDMEREYRILAALSKKTDLPVPPAVAYCSEEEVTGAPFYVMGFVEGRVIHDVDVAREIPEAQRRRAGETLADALSDLHAVDPDAVGLGELGRREGYIERQLRRWHGQLERVKRRELPLLDELHERLLARVPAQVETRLVHGDFGLDNGIFDEGGAMVAILDWEICTLGDPLADLGLLRVRWIDPEDDNFERSPLPPAAGGFPRWAELSERYAKRSGRDLSALGYFAAYAYWKAATMLEATRARHESGSTAGQTDFKGFGNEYVTFLLEKGRSILEGASR
jgi:aminoglycoside phosphotransferase (APT) family kinase protein